MVEIIQNAHALNADTLRDLIQHYGQISTYYDPMHETYITKMRTEIPFQISRDKITLDYEKIQTLNLSDWPTEKDDRHMPRETVFRKIPYYVQHKTTQEENTNPEFVREEATEQILEKIQNRLETGYVEYPVYGKYSYEEGYQFPDPRPEIYESNVWWKSSLDTIQRRIKCGIQKIELIGVIGEPLSIENADKVTFFNQEVKN